MELKTYYNVVLDANFISNVQYVDSDCLLIDEINEHFGLQCFVSETQYNRSPCNHASTVCQYIENSCDVDDVIEFYMNYPGIEKIESCCNKDDDIIDLFIIYYAYKKNNSLVLSCDRGIIIICNDLLINVLCFKAAMVRLNYFINIFSDPTVYTDVMFESGENPFFYFNNTNACSCCDGPCEFYKP